MLRFAQFCASVLAVQRAVAVVERVANQLLSCVHWCVLRCWCRAGALATAMQPPHAHRLSPRWEAVRVAGASSGSILCTAVATVRDRETRGAARWLPLVATVTVACGLARYSARQLCGPMLRLLSRYFVRTWRRSAPLTSPQHCSIILLRCRATLQHATCKRRMQAEVLHGCERRFRWRLLTYVARD